MEETGKRLNSLAAQIHECLGFGKDYLSLTYNSPAPPAVKVKVGAFYGIGHRQVINCHEAYVVPRILVFSSWIAESDDEHVFKDRLRLRFRFSISQPQP